MCQVRLKSVILGCEIFENVKSLQKDRETEILTGRQINRQTDGRITHCDLKSLVTFQSGLAKKVIR